MTVTVACPMNFKYYPADTQLCDIDMQTCNYFRIQYFHYPTFYKKYFYLQMAIKRTNFG